MHAHALHTTNIYTRLYWFLSHTFALPFFCTQNLQYHLSLTFSFLLITPLEFDLQYVFRNTSIIPHTPILQAQRTLVCLHFSSMLRTLPPKLFCCDHNTHIITTQHYAIIQCVSCTRHRYHIDLIHNLLLLFTSTNIVLAHFSTTLARGHVNSIIRITHPQSPIGILWVYTELACSERSVFCATSTTPSIIPAFLLAITTRRDVTFEQSSLQLPHNSDCMLIGVYHDLLRKRTSEVITLRFAVLHQTAPEQSETSLHTLISSTYRAMITKAPHCTKHPLWTDYFFLLWGCLENVSADVARHYDSVDLVHPRSPRHSLHNHHYLLFCRSKSLLSLINMFYFDWHGEEYSMNDARVVVIELLFVVVRGGCVHGWHKVENEILVVAHQHVQQINKTVKDKRGE